MDMSEILSEEDRARVRAEGRRAKPNGDARRSKETERPLRFTLLPFGSIKPNDGAQYLVKGLLPRVGLAVVWGEPKCGKSFWAFDALMHLALGWTYRGRRVTAGPVVYCALEGAQGFKNRIEAFRQERLSEAADAAPPFYLMPASLDLVRDAKSLIVDIRAAFDCLVVIVHHCGHNGDRPRGHSSLMGALDVQIAIKRDAAGNIVAELELSKDGESGLQFVSRLRAVEIGVDQDGDAITSCVVEAADAPPAARKAKPPPPSAQTALRALRKAIEEAGEPAPASNTIPPNVRVVSVETWRAYAYQSGISDGAEESAKRANIAAMSIARLP